MVQTGMHKNEGIFIVNVVGAPIIYTANVERTRHVVNQLPADIIAKSVVILPIDFNSMIAMRMSIIGDEVVGA